MIPRYQADAVWWSLPISSALAALLALFHYRFGNWRAARMTAPEPAADAAPDEKGLERHLRKP